MHATTVVSFANPGLQSPASQAEEFQAQKPAARREQIFQELYDCHHKDVHNYVLWFLDGCRDVEDIVQEVFLKVFERLDDYDPTRPARPWLLRIAGNVALNYVEKHMAQKRIAEGGKTVSLSRRSSDGEFVIDAPDHREMLPEEHAIQEETLERLRGFLNDLPELEWEMICSIYFDGMSQREVAEMLDIPRETVRGYHHKLLGILKTMLESDPALKRTA